MKTFKIAISSLALGLLASPAIADDHMDHSEHAGAMADDAEAASVETPAATGETVTAKVNGLVCDFCAQSIKKVFKKQDAVETVNVDLDNGQVVLGLKEGMSLDDETIGKLIRKSGYSLVEITRTGGA